jgi:hypothetical protein
VRKYCVAKLTVKAVSLRGATLCAWVPPSLQLAYTNRVAVSPCGDVAEIVWSVVADHTNAWDPA